MFMRSSFSLKGIGVSVLAVIAFAALTARSESSIRSGPLVFTSMLASAAPTNPAEPVHEQTVPVLLITIRPSGFDPGEIRSAPGRFLLAVDNKSGLDDLRLRLNRENANRLSEVNLAKGQIKWRQKVDLPAGRYVLTEENRPTWVCHIIIEE